MGEIRPRGISTHARRSDAALGQESEHMMGSRCSPEEVVGVPVPTRMEGTGPGSKGHMGKKVLRMWEPLQGGLEARLLELG